jgi:hypothetical protein
MAGSARLVGSLIMVQWKSRSVTSSRRYYFSVADGSSHPVPQVFRSKQLRFLDAHPLTKCIGIDPWPYGPHRITSTLQLQMTGLLLRNHRHDLCTRTTCPRMVSWEWEQMCNPVLGQFMAFFVGPSYPVSFWPNKGSVHIFSTETQKPPKTAIRIRVIGPFAAVLWQHDCPLRSRHRPRWRPPCSFNVLRLLFGDFIIDPKISAFLVLKSFDAFYLHVVHTFPSSLPKKMLSYEILPKCLGNQLIMEHPENLRNIPIDSPKRQRI